MLQHAAMRDGIIAVVALMVVAQGVATILLWRRARGLSRTLAESTQRRAAAHEQIRRAFASGEGPPEENWQKRKHLRVVPIFAGLAAAAGWVRQHPGPAAAGAAAAGAAVLALLLPGSSTSDDAAPPTPPPTTTSTAPASRSPSLTSPVPAPGVASSTETRAGGTTTGAVPPLDDASTSSMPTTRPSTTPPSTTPPTTTPPASTTTAPPTATQPAPARCLLRIQLRTLVDLCLVPML